MLNNYKKTITKILVLLMVLSLIPSSVFADTDETTPDTPDTPEWGIYALPWEDDGWRYTDDIWSDGQDPAIQIDGDTLTVFQSKKGYGSNYSFKDNEGSYTQLYPESHQKFKLNDKLAIADSRCLVAGYFEKPKVFHPVDVTWKGSEGIKLTETSRDPDAEAEVDFKTVTVQVKPETMGKTMTLSATDAQGNTKTCNIYSPLTFTDDVEQMASHKPLYNAATGDSIDRYKLEVGESYYAQFQANQTGLSKSELENLKNEITKELSANPPSVEFLDKAGEVVRGSIDSGTLTFDRVECGLNSAETDVVVNVYFTVHEAIVGGVYAYIYWGGKEGYYCTTRNNVRTSNPRLKGEDDWDFTNSVIRFSNFNETKQINFFDKDETKVTEGVTWTSADDGIATVNNGLITSKGTGTTTITATYQGRNAACQVSCYQDGIYIGEADETKNRPLLDKDARPITEYTFDAAATSDKTLQLWYCKDVYFMTQDSWFSDNIDIAEITSGIQSEDVPGGERAIANGKMTLKKNGTVTISAGGKDAEDIWGTCRFTVTGFDRDSDPDNGWIAWDDYQTGLIYGQKIKLSNHSIMTQSLNNRIFENRLTDPVKANACEFTFQLNSSAKNGPGSTALDDELAKESNQTMLINSAKDNITLWKMKDGARTEQIASIGDGLTLKDTKFDTSGTLVVTHQIAVDKNLLEKGQSYALVVGTGIKAYMDGSLAKTAVYQFETMAPAKSVTLDKNQLELKPGDSSTLTAEMNKGEEVEADDTIIWTSTDDTIADVDNNGKVTAKKAGTTTIVATAMDGKVKAECKVTVSETAVPPTTDSSVSVTGIKLNVSKATLNVGKTKQLTATIAPENATNKNVTWTSSNKKIAKVDAKGKVTAVAAGKATITAKTDDGAFTAKAVITVKAVKVTGVKVNVSKASLAVGKTKTLKATVAPANATNKNVTWTSSNKKIAKVSAKGKVTAVAPGQATITVTTKDGKFKKKTVITVKPKAPAFTLSSTKRTATIKYKKVSGATGYEIYRADSKNGKYYKITTRKQAQMGICTSYNLKAKHTYYYKIRTYQTVNGKKLYSSYSAVKKVKTK